MENLQVIDLSQSQSQDDPWDLPEHFLLRNNRGKSLSTYSGYWKEREEEVTAIRSAGESSSSSSSAPSYVGVRKTLEFYLRDGTNGGEGTKTDWTIHQYHNLRKDGDTGDTLFLEEDAVLRKVFKKCKSETDHASSVYPHVESCVKALKDKKEWEERRRIFSSQYTFRMSDSNIGYRFLRMSDLYGFLNSWLQDAKESPDTSHNELFNLLARSYWPEPASYSMEAFPHNKSALATFFNERTDGLCKPHKVWDHFTKIRTSDPDEVYAACHRCDRVLKVHRKKHGTTSHLKSHIHTCSSSSCTANPSTDEDREMLRHLRAVLDNPYERQKMMDCHGDDLAQLEPKLTPWYVTRSSKNMQTQGGHWEEIDKEFIAIRMDQQGGCWKDIGSKEITQLRMQLPQPLPQYLGLRRTLQFRLHNGRKSDWMMLEYQQLDDIDIQSPALLLQGGMVIRKVFLYDKDAVASAFSELDVWLNADDDDDEGHFNGEGMNTDATTTSGSDCMDTPVDRKRKRTGAASGHKSKVWMHFTKIYNTDYGLVYVVCHSCDRGYTSGHSTNGTTHLWRHTKSCSSKLPGTGNANSGATTAAWEAEEIWPLFLLLKNYGETEQQASGMW